MIQLLWWFIPIYFINHENTFKLIICISLSQNPTRQQPACWGTTGKLPNDWELLPPQRYEFQSFLASGKRIFQYQYSPFAPFCRQEQSDSCLIYSQMDFVCRGWGVWECQNLNAKQKVVIFYYRQSIFDYICVCIDPSKTTWSLIILMWVGLINAKLSESFD